MAKSLTITFDSDQTDVGTLVHRVRNFGEDAYRLLSDNQWCEIDLKKVDAAATKLIVRKIKSSKFRRLNAWIESEMQRQNLSGLIEVH